MAEHPAVAFLRQAHKRATALARAATPSPWTVDNEIHPESIDSAGGVEVVAGSRWGGEASVFETAEDARHIALHDPAAVLRRIAAERQILARHEPWRAAGVVRCRDDGLIHDLWPCPTLLLLAEAWGWTGSD